jgi:hypothetical protein
MKRLSGLDNLFVMLDSERYPLHGAAIFVLDPATAPNPSPSTSSGPTSQSDAELERAALKEIAKGNFQARERRRATVHHL